jgi:capsular exopolysaccharide synthesis family protein
MDENELNLRAIFGLLRRQFRLIAVTVVAVVALATLVAFTLTPTFTSSALILVDPSNKNLLAPEAQMNSSAADSARIDSEVELARSDNVLLRAIRDENLVTDPEFGVSIGLWTRVLTFLRLRTPALPSGEQAVNQALSELRSAVSVQRRGLTYLISVQVRSEQAEKAARITNAIAESYIADQLASKVDSVLASYNVLQARIGQAREAIVSSEGQFDTFVSDNMQRIIEDSGRTDLAQMQQQMAQLQAARDQSQRSAEAVTTYLANEDWSSIVSTLQSSALDELAQQRQDLADQLSQAGADTPTAVNLRDELAAIENRLRETASSEVSDLRASVTQNQTQEDTLRQRLRQEVLGSSLSADVLTRLYELQQGAELARTQYQTLLARSQDLEAQADLQLADSRIVSPALPPERPSFPNKPLIIILAALAGLGLGAGLAFLRENLIGGFTTEEQVESVLRQQVAASVPRERAKSERESLANLMVTSPLSLFAESIRRIRAVLDQDLRSPDEESLGSRVILVTSTAPNEGKTTTALALARSYSLAGYSTLLIDCDLRKPSIHRHLNLDPSQGLLDFLTDEAMRDVGVQNIVSKDNLTEMTLIIGSRRSDLPTDQLLAGPAFGRLIAAARNSFAVIVLDSPPLAPVVDGRYIARFADAIVVVLRWATTAQTDARRALANLDEAKRKDAKTVVVLNQLDISRSGYERKYGGYYAAYDN